MKFLSQFAKVFAVIFLISCNSEGNEVENIATNTSIVFENANPLSVDLSGYKPKVKGYVNSETPLNAFSASLEYNNGETLLLEEADLQGVLEYSFEFEITYGTNISGVRIDVTDENKNSVNSTLNISAAYVDAVEGQAISDIDAFVGAEGFGRYTTGGRGGKILIVDNLLDDNKQGCLRWAVNQNGARTIVFKVAGYIELNSPLKISNDNITIAGHSAPGDGVCIAGDYVQLADGLDNVIIRYMRFRPARGNDEYDACWGRNCSNIIIDHCSFSWGNDEVASFYDNTNFTMQWCMVSESFYHSTHPKGNHGYGGIWGGMNASFHHNLIAHHTSRNPRFCGARFHEATRDLELVDFRNNVIYNWGGNSIYGGEMGKQNMVNNYFKSGPATSSTKKNRIVEISSEDSEWYIEGNYVYGYPDITNDNWQGGVQGESTTATRANSPFTYGDINTATAQDAYTDVLTEVGASYYRDDLDSRIISEVDLGKATYGGVYGSGTGIIDSQEDVGGYPVLNDGTAIIDLDNDGMDDDWEEENGLDPNDNSDHGDYSLDRKYTNIEVYLNSLVD